MGTRGTRGYSAATVKDEDFKSYFAPVSRSDVHCSYIIPSKIRLILPQLPTAVAIIDQQRRLREGTQSKGPGKF